MATSLQYAPWSQGIKGDKFLGRTSTSTGTVGRMTEPATEAKRRKGRSPGYPGVDLETALARADTLWQAHRNHPVNVETVLALWGYGRQSGAGLVALAALKKFGLLNDEGSGDARRAHLSDDARAIILDQRPDSAERLGRIRKAALTPPIHKELWSRYQRTLPQDETLHFYLTNERDFTENGASDFISQFRRTVAFARLGSSADDSLSGEQGDINEPDLEDQDPLENSSQSTSSPAPIQFPVGAATVTVKFSAELDQRDWDRMLRLLTAMKPDEES